MLDFSGISLPFNVGELLTSGVQLLTVVGPFVLLGMALSLAPLIKSIIEDFFALKKHSDDDKELLKHVVYKRTGGDTEEKL